MRGLIITACILGALILIGFIRIRLKMTYGMGEDDGFRLALRVLFYRKSIVPAKDGRIRLRDYTPRAIEKRERKDAERAAAKAEKKAVKDAEKAKKKEAAKHKPKEDRLISNFSDLTELVALILETVGVLLKKFFLHLHTDIRALRLSIGGDPAKAAIAFGGIRQSILYLLSTLEQHSKLKVRKHLKGEPDLAAVDLSPGFGQAKFAAKVDIRFSISVGAVLAVVIVTAWRFLISKHNRLIKKIFKKKKKTKPSAEEKLGSATKTKPSVAKSVGAASHSDGGK